MNREEILQKAIEKAERMTQQEFDNYRFSVNTEVNYFEDQWGKVWDKVIEVNFENRWVGIERGQIIKFDEIKGIREALSQERKDKE